MEYFLRPATLNDTAAIAEINVIVWKATYPGILPQDYLDRLTVEDKLTHYEQRLRRHPLPLVVEDSVGRIVGYSIFELRSETEEYTAELTALAVLPELQGQGLGKRLLKATAKVLHAERHRNFCTWVLKENILARVFYEHCGGVFAGEKTFEIDELTIPEVCYGLLDMADLLDE